MDLTSWRKPRIRDEHKRKASPEHITDSFILHFEEIRPTHKAAKVVHRVVYLVGLGLLGMSVALNAGVV